MEAGFEPRIVQEVSNLTTKLSLISVGVGIGLVSMGPGWRYPADVAIVRLLGIDYATSFELQWLKDGSEPALERFIETVKMLALKKW